MTSERYTKLIDQIEPCETESLANLLLALTDDGINLTQDNVEMLTRHIAEKVREGVKQQGQEEHQIKRASPVTEGWYF